jgi:hypothetical protein
MSAVYSKCCKANEEDNSGPIFLPESQLLHDWRFPANQFVLATSPLRLKTSNFISQLNTCGYSPYVTSSLTRGCVSFTIASGPRQRSHSRIRVPSDSWSHFTVSDSRLPTWRGRSPYLYPPQDKGGPVIPPVTGFPLRRLLRLAGLRWRYSTPPTHGPNTKDRIQEFYCSVCACRCGNVFTEPLPSNGHLFWLNYFGF